MMRKLAPQRKKEETTTVEDADLTQKNYKLAKELVRAVF